MKSFMIVDDSFFQRKNLERIVFLMGGEVVVQASNGKEAVELYPYFRPDIVLIDARDGGDRSYRKDIRS